MRKRVQATVQIERDDRWWEDPERIPEGTRIVGAPGGPQGVWTELEDGTRHGRFTHFHSGGGKAGEHVFDHGVMTGPCVGWYANGRLQVTGAYAEDAPDGTWTFYREDGSVLRVDHYERGELVGSERHGPPAAQREQKLAGLVETSEQPDCAGDVARPLADIVGWFRDHASPCFEAFTEGASPLTEDDRDQLEGVVGRIPGDFAAYQLLAHGYCRMSFFEYSSLDIEHIVEVHRNLSERFASSDEPPPRLPEDSGVHASWWRQGWVPFAEDGGGNLICIDLDPAPGGKRGQVFYWDSLAGPRPPVASSFLEFFESYAADLVGGGYRYDPDSGAFDRVRGR